MIAGYVTLGCFLFAFVAVTAASGTAWAVVVFGVPFAAAGAYLCFQALRTGVCETAEGLAGRAFTQRSQCAWQHVVGFRFARAGAQELIIADCAGGGHVIVRGARRCMRWKGGGITDDFAALLDERRRLFVGTSAPVAEDEAGGISA